MSIAYVGSLPVSALNIGLAASLAGIQIEIDQLTVDLAGITPAIAGEAAVKFDFPPNVPALTAAFGLATNPLQVAAELNPGTWSLGSIELSADITAELGLVTAKLEAILAIAAPLEAGLAIGGIAGWSYSGTARGFGERLRADTEGGFGRTPPAADVRATIIATESPTSWLGFSQGFNTGSDADGLHYMGQLGAAEWNTGLGTIMTKIRLLILQLEGLKATLEHQLQVARGLELPSVDVIIDGAVEAIAELGIDGLLDNLVNIDANITVEIGSIQARINALLALQLELAAQLSGGGMAAWTYEGTASLLGTSLLTQIRNGVPGGNGPSAAVNGLVLASTPATMNTFGNIFLV